MAITAERADFTGAQGDTLAARIDRPRGPARAWALFAHCFSCSKDVFAASRISKRLAENGVGVLRFDFTGLGNSEGDFANSNFSSNVQDLVLAADWLRRERVAPSLLIGHSLGGAAVLVAADQIPEARAVVTLAAPADAQHVRDQFADDVSKIERDGEARVLLAGRPFTIKAQFLEDIAKQNVERAAGGLRRALLVAHSPIDQTVGIDHATRIFVSATHPKSFLSLDGADHLISKHDDAVYAADAIAGWASRYIEGGGPEAPKPHKAPNGVAVRETGAGKYMNDIVAGDHTLRADEPVAVGGDDAGPNPYELLNASLGACTSMTLRMYADRKGWPLQRVTVRLSHEKTHAEDCETCDEDEKARVDVITRELVIEGELDADQRAKLLEIADKCPVHRTLHGPVVVRTKLLD